MMRYRKKPVEIEAIQYTGDNFEAVREFTGEGQFAPIDPEDRVDFPDCDVELYTTANGIWIPIEVGEWVILDSRGYYPCKDDVFTATYDPVEDA